MQILTKFWPSDIARTSRILGHSMATLRLYELLCVWSPEAFRWSEACSPKKYFHSLPGRFWSYIVLQCTSLIPHTHVWWAYDTHNSVDYTYILRHWISRPNLQSTTILSVPIIHMHTCTGGARPLVARACVQPGYATVLALFPYL